MKPERRRRHHSCISCNLREWITTSAVFVAAVVAFSALYKAPSVEQLAIVDTQISRCPENSLACRDSFDFFSDVNDNEWIVRKEIARTRIHNAYPDSPIKHAGTPTTWYQENWDPDWSCAAEQKVGNTGDGHKWVCDPHRISPDCIAYSVGSNGDFSFEMALHEQLPSCDIHIFDFTDYTSNMPRRLKAHFHPWGLRPSYDTNTSEWDTAFSTQPWSDPKRPNLQFKTLKETMEILGHERVDLFKIDCEGCEWQSYEDWTKADLRQILVEVHDSPPAVVNDFFLKLHHAGFVIFHKEPNTQFSFGRCQEIGFFKMAKSFFSDTDTK